MPAKSKKQQRFMGSCLSKPRKGCPPRSVARKMAKNPRSKRGKR